MASTQPSEIAVKAKIKVKAKGTKIDLGKLPKLLHSMVASKDGPSKKKVRFANG